MEQNIRNCQNYGAPINGNICSYCGTVFYNQDYIDTRKLKQTKFKKKYLIIMQ